MDGFPSPWPRGTDPPPGAVVHSPETALPPPNVSAHAHEKHPPPPSPTREKYRDVEAADDAAIHQREHEAARLVAPLVHVAAPVWDSGTQWQRGPRGGDGRMAAMWGPATAVHSRAVSRHRPCTVPRRPRPSPEGGGAVGPGGGHDDSQDAVPPDDPRPRKVERHHRRHERRDGSEPKAQQHLHAQQGGQGAPAGRQPGACDAGAATTASGCTSCSAEGCRACLQAAWAAQTSSRARQRARCVPPA